MIAILIADDGNVVACGIIGLFLFCLVFFETSSFFLSICSCEVANYCLLSLNNWPFARKLTAFISNIELDKWDEFISLTIPGPGPCHVTAMAMAVISKDALHPKQRYTFVYFFVNVFRVLFARFIQK